MSDPRQKTYIMEVEDLRKIAIGSLGPMTEDTYDGFMVKAKALGDEHGIANPILVLDVKFLPGKNQFGLLSYPYPVVKEEWASFLATLDIADGTPEVRVADGDRYAFPI